MISAFRPEDLEWFFDNRQRGRDDGRVLDVALYVNLYDSGSESSSQCFEEGRF